MSTIISISIFSFILVSLAALQTCVFSHFCICSNSKSQSPRLCCRPLLSMDGTATLDYNARLTVLLWEVVFYVTQHRAHTNTQVQFMTSHVWWRPKTNSALGPPAFLFSQNQSPEFWCEILTVVGVVSLPPHLRHYYTITHLPAVKGEADKEQDTRTRTQDNKSL